MTVADVLIIVGASLASTFLAEAIAWLLIYRTASYQRLKESMEKLSAKVEKKKESGSSPLTQRKDKKADRYEDQLKRVNSELSWVRMKSMGAVAVTMASLFGILASAFDGKVVARLPFEPWSLVQGVSHRGLLGNDIKDCAWLFIYVLGTVSFRPTVQKLLGTTPPKAQQTPFGGMFDMPKK